MKNLKKFHRQLMKESGIREYTVEEKVDKDLAKEDALALVSEFVKDVKKKFPNKQDKLEILKDVSKTLEFYINEIENSSSIDVMSVTPSSPALNFDDVSKSFDSSDDFEDSDYGSED